MLNKKNKTVEILIIICYSMDIIKKERKCKIMKKTVIVLIVLIILALIVGGIFLLKNSNTNLSTALKLETAEDMKALISKIYEETNNEMFGLETRELDLNDELTLSVYTGLKSNSNIDRVVVSESMITSRAYSLALVKTKANADVEAIKKEMIDNIDMRRWICVEAEVAYATNSGDVIFLVMSDEAIAKQEYDAFKKLAENKIGKELERKAEIPEF